MDDEGIYTRRLPVLTFRDQDVSVHAHDFRRWPSIPRHWGILWISRSDFTYWLHDDILVLLEEPERPVMRW